MAVPSRRPRRNPASAASAPAEATEVPSTLQRSEPHAQALWKAAHDSAARTYGDGERAHRTAFAALKHSYEKVADHWERKVRRGPSDAQAERGGPAARRRPRQTAGGVDANAAKAHLLELARRLDVKGRSKMTKDDLVRALRRANDKATAAARRRG